MTYQGFYINLDRSVQRRTNIEAQLARYGLQNRYRRFSAADGNVLGLKSNRLNDAELGCFASHYLLLKENHNTDSYLHIIEDDTIFCKDTHWAIECVINFGQFNDYDILFTDTFLPSDWNGHQFLKKMYDRLISQTTKDRFAWSLINYTACMNSYIIKPSSIGRVLNVIESALENGPTEGIDLLIRTKATEGQIRVACIFPFVTSVLIGDVFESVKREGRDKISELACGLGRASFFMGRDLEKLAEYSGWILSAVQPDTHADLLARIYRLTFSDKFQYY